jgi:hypothetical protein
MFSKGCQLYSVSKKVVVLKGCESPHQIQTRDWLNASAALPPEKDGSGTIFSFASRKRLARRLSRPKYRSGLCAGQNSCCYYLESNYV